MMVVDVTRQGILEEFERELTKDRVKSGKMEKMRKENKRKPTKIRNVSQKLSF